MEGMLKELRRKAKRATRDEGVASFRAGARERNLGKAKGVALSPGTGEERAEIAKLKERMEMMMGVFGRLAKGMMLEKDVDAVGRE